MIEKRHKLKVNLGGIVPLSTVDMPGIASTVIFFRGCPLRCPHCQNKELQTGTHYEDLSILKAKVKAGLPFISGMVFSGGEPLMQPEPLIHMAHLAKELELAVGVETCGYYPDHLAQLIEEGVLDRVFLDVKAALKDPEYARATGREVVFPRVKECLKICQENEIPMEVRTTLFPEMPSQKEVDEIVQYLSEMGIKNLVLQQGLPVEGIEKFKPVSEDYIASLARSAKDRGINAKYRCKGVERD